MSKIFTSIFHEEVIPVNETRSEIKAHYADRRSREHHTGRHDLDKEDKKNLKRYGDEIRDKGDYASSAEPMKNKHDYYNREYNAKNRADRDNNATRNIESDRRKRKEKAQRESFLPEIELI